MKIHVRIRRTSLQNCISAPAEVKSLSARRVAQKHQSVAQAEQIFTSIKAGVFDLDTVIERAKYKTVKV